MLTEKSKCAVENNTPTLLIRDLPLERKPREKAIAQGFDALTDAELMAIIFSTGIKGKSVLQLSEDILRDNDGHLSMLMRMTPQQIMERYKGIGQAKAVTLLAALHLGERSRADCVERQKEKICTSELAFRKMAPVFLGLDHEEFWLLLLNRALMPLKSVRLGVGGLSATVVDAKVAVRAALDAYASAVIMLHNHPSGNTMPSPQDDVITRKVNDAMALFDIKVNDHLIVTDGDYYSYHDNGRVI